MALSLTKGSKLNLAKEGGLDFVRLGLGWDTKKFDTQADFDLDVSAFVLKDDGTPFGAVLTLPAAGDGWVCFYQQKVLGNNAVKHLGDNLTGNGAGDDETIEINFKELPVEAQKIAVVVTIHEADTRKQNFGQVENAYCKVYDQSGAEKAEFKLDEQASTATALLFVEFKKNGTGEWVLGAIGEGFNKDLGAFFAAFKVPGF